MPFLHWDGHSAHVMRLITQLYMDAEFFDCTLDTIGGLVQGHKTILVACSPYLKKLITDHHGMEIIPFKEVKYKEMKLILDLVYFGEVDVSVTDMPSLIETAQLLQFTSLSSYTLKLVGNSCSYSICDVSMDNSATTSGVNVTKCDDCHLSVQDMKQIGNQDIHHEKEDHFTNDCESVDLQPIHGLNTNTIGVGQELLQKQCEIDSNLNVQNSSVIKMDTISKEPEIFQDELPPISFVAVSPFSMKNENIDDEQNASCVSHSELKNPLEENPLNCDMLPITNVKREKEFLFGSEVKIEVKEENYDYELGLQVTKNSSLNKTLEMNGIDHELENLCDQVTKTTDHNMFMTADDIHVEESTEIDTSLKTQDCDHSKSSSDEGMNEVEMEFESICDVAKCDLKEVKPFETDRDNETINDKNDLLTLKDVSESSKHVAGKISLTNFEKDVNQGLGVPILNNLKIKETTDILERTRTPYEIATEKTQSAFQISSSVMKKIPLQREREFKKGSGDKESSMCYTDCSSEVKCDNHFASQATHEVHNASLMLIHSAKKPFSCGMCDASFREKSTLKKHMLIHTGEKPFSCKTCNASFRKKGNLKQHMGIHSGDRPFSCGMCDASFREKSSLKKHMLIHTDEKPFSCKTCNASFREKGNLKQHMGIHSGDRPFSCGMCDASFRLKDTLKKHMFIHTGEKPFSCETCHVSFIKKCHLRRHVLIHTGDKPFSCVTCDASYREKGALKQHMRNHSGEKPFSCGMCDGSFRNQGTLKQHMRIHTGEKPFSCGMCGASFRVKGTLKDHMLIHTGEKPFACKTCNASFRDRGTLKKHMRIHTGEKPFSCGMCGASFRVKGNLKNHMLIHTGEKPFACGTCGALFREKSKLKRHALIHTGEKRFSCDVCNVSFRQKRQLKNHMLSHADNKLFL